MLFAALRILLVFLLLAPLARAENVALVLSENSGPYAEFSTTFREAIEGGSWKVSSQGSADALDSTGERPDLIVAVGSQAFRQVLARGGQIPVLATLIPRLPYEKLVAENTSRGRRISGIWLDQPAARLASFLRLLLPGKNRIGLLTSNQTRLQVSQFRQAFSAAGLIVDSEDSDTEQTLLPSLNTLLSRVNVLLAIPDASIYQRDNIKSILITSYRYQRPVIAFSPAFVKAGALAALYSTPAQMAHQSADLIHTYGIALPPAMAPSQFAVTINQNVAQAFDLKLQDEADIRRALLADKEAR